MSHNASDRNLLFGILALQMEFITRDALVAAMHAWVLDKQKTLGDILVAQGALADADRALLEPMVARHIQMHGGDPEKSLAAVSSVGYAREALGAVADFDVQASVARLARKMLKGYPRVARWEQTDDVLQNALIRLDRALKTVTPPTARDFFRLAAAQVRRELIDLARRYYGPEGQGAHHSTRPGTGKADAASDHRREPAESTYDPGRLAAWTEFHRRIEELPQENRELFDLLWYQGLSQPEAARIWVSRNGLSTAAGWPHG
jgi:RNA polymerase sigma factor (sigma-70 family)